MKICILSVLVSFILPVSYGQSACDVNKISTKDKNLLQDFCSRFTKAVQSQNKEQLATLFNFPFTCASCDDSTQQEYAPFVKITKQSFYAFQYKNFVTAYLAEVVTKYNLFDILRAENGSEKQYCSYNFSYPIIKPTKKFEGSQCFLTITELGSGYKIVAAWTVP